MNDMISYSSDIALCLAVFVCVYALIHCYYVCSYYNGIGNGENHDNHHHVIISIEDLVGLKRSVLQSIPVVDFNSKDFKDGVDCVVCLSELSEGDKARVLPSCNHCFHADCIDTWFQSRSTCPICRQRVVSAQPKTMDEGLTQNHAPSPETNPPPPSPSTSTVVHEDKTNEVEQDLTSVVVDIPAKGSENIPTQVL